MPPQTPQPSSPQPQPVQPTQSPPLEPQPPVPAPPMQPQPPVSTQPLQPQTNAYYPPPPYANATPAKKRFPKWLLIVGVIVAIFFVIPGIFLGIALNNATKAPQLISDQFINEVQAGNTTAAYQLTSKSFQEVSSKEQLDAIIKRVGPILQGEEKVIGRSTAKSSGVPQTAALSYTVSTSKGTKYMKTELQKTGEDWQIINFRSDDKPID